MLSCAAWERGRGGRRGAPQLGRVGDDCDGGGWTVWLWEQAAAPRCSAAAVTSAAAGAAAQPGQLSFQWENQPVPVQPGASPARRAPC